MEARLFETARQASLRDRMRNLLDRHGVGADDAAMDVDDGNDGNNDTAIADPVRSRSPTPPSTELDENGRFTTRAKGKGRAT